MALESDAKEDVVSEPLQHLLSLKWETLPDVSTMTMVSDENKNKKASKHVKKVRFSDEIKQNYLETYYDEQITENINCDNKYTDQEDQLLLNDKEFKLSENNDEINSSFFDSKKYVGNSVSSVKHIYDSSESESYGSDFEHSNFDKEVVLEENYNDYHETNKNCNNFSINSTDSFILTKDDSEENESFCLDNEFHVDPEQNGNIVDNHILEKIASIQIKNGFPILKENDSSSRKDDINLSSCKIIKNLCHQKQTEKINTLLNEVDNNFSSVPEMKSTVIEIWNTIKKEIKITKSDDARQIDKTVLPNKSTKYEVNKTTKISKFKKKRKQTDKMSKLSLQLSNKVEKSKIDQEENELAYKAWKKQKDTLIKQESERKLREQEEKKIFMLMDKEIKKEDAQSAYLSWLAHKVQISKKEKSRQRWMMEKNEETNKMRMKRDKAALEMYNLWLESKYLEEREIAIFPQKRPPWIPLG